MVSTSGRVLGSRLAVMIAGRGGGLVASLLITAMMTRQLGPFGYGVYQTAIAYVGLIILLVDFGLPSIVVREISTPGADEQCLIGNAITLRLAITGCALLIALLAVTALPFSGEEKRGIAFALPGFLAYSLHLMMFGLFQRHLKQGGAVLAELTGVTLLVLTVYVLCRMDAGPIAFCVALSGSYIVVLSIALVFANRIVPLQLRFDRRVWRDYAKAALPLAGAATMTVVALKSPTVVLAMLSTEQEVGKFATSQQVFNSLIGISVLFVGLIAPPLANAASRNPIEMSRLLHRAILALLVGGIGLALALASSADTIITLLAGDEFGSASTILMLFMPLFVIHSLSLILREAATAMHRQELVAPCVGIGLAATLVGFATLVPRLHGSGVVLALLAGEVLVAGGLLRVMTRAGISDALGQRGIRIIACGGVGFLTILLVRSTNLGPWLSPVLTGLVYLGALLATGAIGTGEVRAFYSEFRHRQ